MPEEEIEKIMEDWISYKIGSTPEMSPTEEMHRVIEANKTRKTSFLYFVRWTPAYTKLAVAGIAAIILLVIGLPTLLLKEEIAVVGLRVGGEIVYEDPVLWHTMGPESFFRQLIFYYHKQDAQTAQGFDVQAPTVPLVQLSSDDNYQFSLQPATNCYVYIYQLGPSGKLTKLFPNEKYSSTQNPLRQGQSYDLPSKPNWLYVSDKTKGEERIYIVASTSSRREWDELYTQYAKAKSTSTQQEILSRFLKEIETVREDSDKEGKRWEFILNHQ